MNLTWLTQRHDAQQIEPGYVIIQICLPFWKKFAFACNFTGHDTEDIQGHQ